MIFVAALGVALLATTYTLATGAASADRPVTMIVAFPPGGVGDATARILQDSMQKALGQPIVSKMWAGPVA